MSDNPPLDDPPLDDHEIDTLLSLSRQSWAPSNLTWTEVAPVVERALLELQRRRLDDTAKVSHKQENK